jgi:psp operon transcriptional activator
MLHPPCQFRKRRKSAISLSYFCKTPRCGLPIIGVLRQTFAMERTSQVIGQAGAFLDALERASRAAALDRPVLVIGERGTGKELVAERLHRLSPRWDQPLVVMNCAALPETLIEAELFGHEAGAFTGAAKARAGRFEEADGGTLFLDELGTLSMAAQDRLLRAVEYGEVTRIGSSRPLRVDVRIVAATNEHLPDKVDAGEFRADLLDRLSFEVVTLPPLRARAGDIVVLADHFGRRMASEIGRERWPGFGATALDTLTNYRWPGNVRELRNVVERAVYRWEGAGPIDSIEIDPFQSPYRPQTSGGRRTTAAATAEPAPVLEDAPIAACEAGPSDFKSRVARFERELLARALAENRFNQRSTAESLGLTYDQLRHALRRHDLINAGG